MFVLLPLFLGFNFRSYACGKMVSPYLKIAQEAVNMAQIVVFRSKLHFKIIKLYSNHLFIPYYQSISIKSFISS